jgi:hypothetical protein
MLGGIQKVIQEAMAVLRALIEIAKEKEMGRELSKDEELES